MQKVERGDGYIYMTRPVAQGVWGWCWVGKGCANHCPTSDNAMNTQCCGEIKLESDYFGDYGPKVDNDTPAISTCYGLVNLIWPAQG